MWLPRHAMFGWPAARGAGLDRSLVTRTGRLPDLDRPSRPGGFGAGEAVHRGAWTAPGA